MTDQPAGSIETRKDVQGPAADVRLWVDAMAIADHEEEDWRKRGEAVVERYRDEEKGKHNENRSTRFNILYANVETQLPAIYNSAPTPDVRRRFNDEDPVAKHGAQIIERALSYSIDSYDFHGTMKGAVKDMLLPGRGVARVRYEPFLSEDGSTVDYETVTCELVPWRLFRRGPGRRWEDVPWIAFLHFMTREQLVSLSEEHGNEVQLDTVVDGATDRFKDEKQPPDLFKRAQVWEIWDKETREIKFIAPGYKNAALKTAADEYELEGFFPIPRPLYAVQTTDSLVPVEEYRLYKDQAEELDAITRRITRLVKALKARGVVAATEGQDIMAELSKAEDGTLVPLTNLMGMISQSGGIDKAIWFFPVDIIAAVIEKLYVQREQIKQTIFEITGLADIMRGQTESSETATAQQIKANWGSLRVQDKQAEVARFARDLLRLKAELICAKFSWRTLEMISGVSLPTMQQKQQAQAMLAQLQAAQAQQQPVAT